MFFNIPSSQLLFIFVGAIGLYLLILGVVFGKKLVTTWGRPLRESVLQSSAAGEARKSALQPDIFPPLIDKPADHPSEVAGVFAESDDPYYEVIEEGNITLLKSAEMVVERIQDVINGIASHPANPEEVFSKIHAIVSQYGFFQETEYYEAINSFVAVTVQRDCDLTLTEEDLKSLWVAEAA